MLEINLICPSCGSYQWERAKGTESGSDSWDKNTDIEQVGMFVCCDCGKQYDPENMEAMVFETC